MARCVFDGICWHLQPRLSRQRNACGHRPIETIHDGQPDAAFGEYSAFAPPLRGARGRRNISYVRAEASMNRRLSPAHSLDGAIVLGFHIRDPRRAASDARRSARRE